MLMSILSDYLRLGHHEAVIVTINHSGLSNPAPMGIELKGESIIITPYTRTKTYRNLTSVNELTINLTHDSIIYFDSLYRKERIRYFSSRTVEPPVIDGNVDLYIEGVVTESRVLPDHTRAILTVKPVEVYEGKGSKLAYSRANSCMIEALIYVTKIEALRDTAPRSILMKYAESAFANINIVERLGRGELKFAADFLKQRLRELIGDTGG